MREFHKENIEEGWLDIVEEFPEFIVDPSPEVLDYFHNRRIKNPVFYEDFSSDDLVNLRFGFECGIGWKESIRQYFRDIRLLIERAKSNGHDVSYKTCILKEKFGELRDQGDFYGPDYKLYQGEYFKLCNEVMNKSSSICEICGHPGQLCRKNGGFGWMKTLCPAHEKSNEFYK